jgi:membrane-associated protease RseP (regulator of RpoE activity)
MFSKENPEFRRPPVGPRRSAWPYRFAELFFGTIAKATMIIALVVFVVLNLLSGGTSTDLPTTGKGWRNFLIFILAILIVVAVAIYFLSPTMSHPRP